MRGQACGGFDMNAQLFKEIGKAVLAEVIIPVVIDVGTKAATRLAKQLTETNKIVIRLGVQEESV
jgi:hypothetical protein